MTPQSAAYSLLSVVQRGIPSLGGGVTILAYHLVNGGTSSPVDISAGTFTAHLDALAQSARVVSMDDALDYLDGGMGNSGENAGDPRPLVVLTVDDAYDNFRTHVWPELRRRDLPATLYVPVGFVDGAQGSPINHDALRPCSWDALRGMIAEGGLSIGSHTIRHPNLRRLPLAEAEVEIRDSRRLLEDKLDVPVSTFCYPQAKWTSAVAQLVGQYYRAGVVAGGRQIRSGDARRECLPRLPVRREFGLDIARAVRAPVWLPEWVGDQVRQFR